MQWRSRALQLRPDAAKQILKKKEIMDGTFNFDGRRFKQSLGVAVVHIVILDKINQHLVPPACGKATLISLRGSHPFTVSCLLMTRAKPAGTLHSFGTHDPSWGHQDQANNFQEFFLRGASFLCLWAGMIWITLRMELIQKKWSWKLESSFEPWIKPGLQAALCPGFAVGCTYSIPFLCWNQTGLEFCLQLQLTQTCLSFTLKGPCFRYYFHVLEVI